MREYLIKQAIDENLSDLYVSLRDKNKIMNQIQGKKNTSPKLSVALVICMVTLLVAIGALAAALLGGKDFTQTVVSPIASQSDSDTFTPEEVDEILQFASDNNITLDEAWMERLNRGEGYYKDELMRALVKTELGFYPGQWSLEDQNWYNRLLVDCGIDEHIVSLLPGEDDFTQEEVIQIALDAFSILQTEGDLTDTTKYSRSMTFSRNPDSAYSTMKQWSIDYKALDDSIVYIFTMLDNGIITDLHVYDYIDEGNYQSALSCAALAEEFKQAFGENPIDWSMEEREAFNHATGMARGDEIADEGMRLVSQTRYFLPGSIYTYIEEEEAIRIAREACGADESLTPYVIYTGGDPTAMCWKISFRDDGGQFVSYAQLEGKNGEVEYTGTYEDMPWYAPLVLEYDLPGFVELSTPKTWTVPDDWRSPLLSDGYWDTLEATGYNLDTAETLTAQWNAEYGEDGWPLACSAARWWWDWNPLIKNTQHSVLGIPESTDISSDAAFAIAQSAFLDAAKDVYTQEQLDSVRTRKTPYFYIFGEKFDQRTWSFPFIIDATQETAYESTVEINAKTGEVTEVIIEESASFG